MLIMLQIYLYGVGESGFLDLNPGSVLDMENLSDIFDEDLSTGDFSLPIDIPWTPKNRRLMGFAERLENFRERVKNWKIDVWDSNWPEITGAQLTILDKSGLFSYKRGKFSATVSGSKGLFGGLIKNKSLKSLDLGGKIIYTKASRDFATDVMKGLHPELDGRMAFAPVAIEGYFDTSRNDFLNEFLARDTVNTVIVTGSGVDDWVFGRPDAAAPTVPVSDLVKEYSDYKTVPFFSLKYVLKKVFEEHGFIVGDAAGSGFLSSPDFDDLYLFNNFGVEEYYPVLFPQYQDYTRTITPGNHVPDMLIKDFLKGVFAFFNVFAVFSGNKVFLRFRKEVLTNRKVLALTEFCNPEFESTIENASQETTGYKLDYSWDSNDGLPGDRVKDLASKTLVATVKTKSDLAGITGYTIGRNLTTDDVVLVLAENLYYNVADATFWGAIKWEVFSERLEPYTYGSGERTVDIGMSTLCSYVELNPTTALLEKQPYVGCRQQGSYISFEHNKITTPFGLRAFYIKKQLIGGVSIPTSFNHNLDSNGNKLVPYSLALNGVDGMAQNYHTGWQDLRERGEVVKTTIAANKRALNAMKQHNCYEVNGVIFLPYKTEPSVPQRKGMVVWLMPI